MQRLAATFGVSPTTVERAVHERANTTGRLPTVRTDRVLGLDAFSLRRGRALPPASMTQQRARPRWGCGTHPLGGGRGADAGDGAGRRGGGLDGQGLRLSGGRDHRGQASSLSGCRRPCWRPGAGSLGTRTGRPACRGEPALLPAPAGPRPAARVAAQGGLPSLASHRYHGAAGAGGLGTSSPLGRMTKEAITIGGNSRSAKRNRSPITPDSRPATPGRAASGQTAWKVAFRRHIMSPSHVSAGAGRYIAAVRYLPLECARNRAAAVLPSSR